MFLNSRADERDTEANGKRKVANRYNAVNLPGVSALWRSRCKLDRRNLAAGRKVEDKNADAATVEVHPRDQAARNDVGADDFGASRQDDPLDHGCSRRRDG